MTKTILIILAIIAVIAISIAWWFVGPEFAKVDAKRTGDIRQEYIIQDARVRVSTYEWFYQQYEQIQATKTKAKLAEGQPEEMGIKMVLADMIAEYNAKASMRETKAQWKPTDLPYYIENE